MRRAVAVTLVLTMVVLARQIGGDGAGRFATMALGFILIVAALVGEVFESLRLPRLTGYFLVGLACGPAALNLVTPGMTEQLRLVNGLAVALIAFSAGMELSVERVRAQWAGLWRHGTLLLASLFLCLVLTVLALEPLLPLGSAPSWPLRLATALVAAAVLTSFSPTVVMAVIGETRARGPLTERVLQIVVVADLGVIVLFTLATATARLVLGADVQVWTAVTGIGWEVAGSAIIGLFIGLGIFVYQRFVNQRTGLVLAGVCLVLAEVGSRIGLSPLLSSLAAGVVSRNLAPDMADAMDELLVRVRLPVLVVFFAAAGASFRAGVEHLAWVAAAIVIVRGALILFWNRAAGRWAGYDARLIPLVPFGLISQAGVTLGLAVIVGRDFPGWGSTLETLFIMVISIHELFGPMLFRWALQRAAEIAPVTGEPGHQQVAQ